MGTGGAALDEIILSPAEFIDAWAAHERESARLALAARRLEACGEWAVDGSVSMAAWLRQQCRMSNRDAMALVHRGRFLDKFPVIAEAAHHGVLSAGQITALKVSCPTPVEPVMRTQQVELVAIVASLSVADTEQAASVWRQRAEALVELPEPVEPVRELRTARTVDGLVGGSCSMTLVQSSSNKPCVSPRRGTAKTMVVMVFGVALMRWWRCVRSSTPTTTDRVLHASVPMSN